MQYAKLTTKGQMTLPKDVREDLNLHAGDRIGFVKVDGRYVLIPKTRNAADLAGILHKPGMKPLTLEEIDDAIAEHLAKDEERIRAGR
ncbi:MAG: AbrB/MazE/SpoVT family DNA-binding domain-containing protein [Hyphomicrobiaceae bacterium]|nr:AbrB/MazE/SpoVT family DNA-binding domain-containing protein [Hyphomicrobiaceae bacterium]